MPDPSNPQDLNRYSYVRNNPTNLVDPTGHCGGPATPTTREAGGWEYQGCPYAEVSSAVAVMVVDTGSDARTVGPVGDMSTAFFVADATAIDRALSARHVDVKNTLDLRRFQQWTSRAFTGVVVIVNGYFVYLDSTQLERAMIAEGKSAEYAAAAAGYFRRHEWSEVAGTTVLGLAGAASFPAMFCGPGTPMCAFGASLLGGLLMGYGGHEIGGLVAEELWANEFARATIKEAQTQAGSAAGFTGEADSMRRVTWIPQ